MDLNEFNISQQETEVADLSKRAEVAKRDVDRLQNQLLALADQHDQLMDKRRVAYRDKYTKRFEGIDIRMALVGALVRYQVNFMNVIYFVELPKGTVNAEVNAFISNPVSLEKSVQNGDEMKTNWEPIQQAEDILLRMLTGIQNPGQHEVSLKGKPVYQRLRALREIPAPLIQGIAAKASTYESYLNCCMEIELGN